MYSLQPNGAPEAEGHDCKEIVWQVLYLKICSQDRNLTVKNEQPSLKMTLVARKCQTRHGGMLGNLSTPRVVYLSTARHAVGVYPHRNSNYFTLQSREVLSEDLVHLGFPMSIFHWEY
jgi:hypothetical protein